MNKREESKMTPEQLMRQVGSDLKRMTTFRWVRELEPEYRVPIVETGEDV